MSPKITAVEQKTDTAPNSSETLADATPLKKLCAELKMDPKKARRILRRHWRAEGSDLSHTIRERWAGDASFIDKLRKILQPTVQ